MKTKTIKNTKSKVQQTIMSAAAAEFFKNKREEKGLTQEAVSKALGYKSKQIVSNWERGLCLPPVNSLHDLTKLLSLKNDDVVKIFLKETEIVLNSHLKGKKK